MKKPTIKKVDLKERDFSEIKKQIENLLGRPITFKEDKMLYGYSIKSLRDKNITIEILKELIEIEKGGITLNSGEYFRFNKLFGIKKGNEYKGVIQFRNNKKRLITFKNIKRDTYNINDKKEEYLTIFKTL